MTQNHIGIIFVLTAVLAAAPGAHAAQTAEGCRAAKLNASANAAAKKLKCWAEAAKNSELADPECLVDADTKFAVDFARIESRGACSPASDSASYRSKVDDIVNVIAGDNLCPGKTKIAASGLQGGLKRHSRAIKKGKSADPTCLVKAKDKLFAKFAKVEATTCPSAANAFTIQQQINAAFDAFVPAPTVRLFSAGLQPSGALGDRTTTNANCSSAAISQGLSCSAVVSLLSYSGDAVKDFPASHGLPADVPIIAGAQTIATSWADFLDGSWNTCLGSSCLPSGPAGAGIFADGDRMWSGTKSDGSSGSNCNEWTSASDGYSGDQMEARCYGTADSIPYCRTGATFSYYDGGCNNARSLACVCW